MTLQARRRRTYIRTCDDHPPPPPGAPMAPPPHRCTGHHSRRRRRVGLLELPMVPVAWARSLTRSVGRSSSRAVGRRGRELVRVRTDRHSWSGHSGTDLRPLRNRPKPPLASKKRATRTPTRTPAPNDTDQDTESTKRKVNESKWNYTTVLSGSANLGPK